MEALIIIMSICSFFLGLFGIITKQGIVSNAIQSFVFCIYKGLSVVAMISSIIYWVNAISIF